MVDELSINGSEYSSDTVEKAAQVAPELTRRALNAHASGGGLGSDVYTSAQLQNRMGRQYDGDRDIYDVLGYDTEVDAESYRTKYERQDMASRIVKLPAQDTWRYHPDITDSEGEENSDFENQVQKLIDDAKLFHYLRRADTVSGIGEFGLLFIGLEDKQPLENEVNDSALSDPSNVAFFTPFAQDSVHDWQLGKEKDYDPTDPRYNRPVQYTIDFSDIDDNETEDLQTVHWSRVLHIAEGKDDSDLKGTPRLRPIYNRLQDLEKTIGASAEMFWSGADRKLQFNIDSDNAGDIPDDELNKLDDQVQKLVHDMQQHIKTFNTDINVIGGEEVDPSGIVDEILKFIAGATGIPKRMLTGSERGELASSQDRATWFGRIETRQNTFAEPMILRPVIDRFREWGILPEPQNGTYTVEWPNLFELTEVEKSQVVNNRAQALSRIAPQGNTDIIGDPEQLFEFVLEGEKPDFDEEQEQLPPESMAEQNPEMMRQFEEQFGQTGDD